MVTQPMENDFSPSKMGEKLVPELVVFHTPPPAVAMYQTRPSFGSTARSMIRPDVSAGPISRSVRPAKVFSPYLSFESAAGASAFFVGCAKAANEKNIARMQ